MDLQEINSECLWGNSQETSPEFCDFSCFPNTTFFLECAIVLLPGVVIGVSWIWSIHHAMLLLFIYMYPWKNKFLLCVACPHDCIFYSCDSSELVWFCESSWLLHESLVHLILSSVLQGSISTPLRSVNTLAKEEKASPSSRFMCGRWVSVWCPSLAVALRREGSLPCLGSTVELALLLGTQKSWGTLFDEWLVYRSQLIVGCAYESSSIQVYWSMDLLLCQYHDFINIVLEYR